MREEFFRLDLLWLMETNQAARSKLYDSVFLIIFYSIITYHQLYSSKDLKNKKILFVFLGFVPNFAMDPSSFEERLRKVEVAVAEIKDVLNDKTDPEIGQTIPGLKSQVEHNTAIIESLQGSIGSMSDEISTLTTSLTTSVNSLSSQIFDILNSISGIEPFFFTEYVPLWREQ